ncbi:peptide-methionine (S)-S-oxide reductase MsrA [Flavisphingomonas formosensis]|uniref:peptide-methionine (S)-S-oxide reductase MsrA n=1 Tax=Flavisphingomonas formosensis TaxID=861534 RepID=UPI001E5CB369|nr:peptide-methionine (S)-S-oxide reductase MsrA [Sphingomonas formosensis]
MMRIFLTGFAATAIALGAIGILPSDPAAIAAEGTVQAPAPAYDPPDGATSRTAVLAGGCFWGVQGVFSHVKGVTAAVSGYSGGARATAAYETVSGGDTGHAESVQITYDPRIVSYGSLLRIYFSVVADPTQLNRQGPDQGTQYRGALFPTTPEQTQVARAYLSQLDKAGLWSAPIVTRIEPFKGFYPAETYHQDFLARHPRYPYILVNDLPKVAALKRLYPQSWREQPVLVNARG